MAHFAKLDKDNIAIDIVCVNNIEMLASDGSESEMMGIAFLIKWSGGYSNWKQTSYNGKIRKNYASIGYTYDIQRDAFIPPQPFPSWVLNENTCLWDAPVPMPADGQLYQWDENTSNWVITKEENAS